MVLQAHNIQYVIYFYGHQCSKIYHIATSKFIVIKRLPGNYGFIALYSHFKRGKDKVLIRPEVEE